MRHVILFLAVVFVLSACSTDSLPEPELPVVEVVFTSATYGSEKHSIVLKYQIQTPTPVHYDGIYPLYNKNKAFSMAEYLKNSDITIERSSVNEDDITIFLAEGSSKPTELEFVTDTPWYFYDHLIWEGDIIQAKAYIRNIQPLDVED